MAIDSTKAKAMQAAVDAVFSHLPKVFRTDAVKQAIVKQVERSDGDYERAARQSVLGMFASIDAAMANVTTLNDFHKDPKRQSGHEPR